MRRKRIETKIEEKPLYLTKAEIKKLIKKTAEDIANEWEEILENNPYNAEDLENKYMELFEKDSFIKDWNCAIDTIRLDVAFLLPAIDIDNDEENEAIAYFHTNKATMDVNAFIKTYKAINHTCLDNNIDKFTLVLERTCGVRYEDYIELAGIDGENRKVLPDSKINTKSFEKELIAILLKYILLDIYEE